jgi:hypothetical protein
LCTCLSQASWWTTAADACLPQREEGHIFHLQGISSEWRAARDWLDDEGHLSLSQLAALFSNAEVSVSSVALYASPCALRAIFLAFLLPAIAVLAAHMWHQNATALPAIRCMLRSGTGVVLSGACFMIRSTDTAIDTSQCQCGQNAIRVCPTVQRNFGASVTALLTLYNACWR